MGLISTYVIDPTDESVGYFHSSADADDHALPDGRATVPEHPIAETSSRRVADADEARR